MAAIKLKMKQRLMELIKKEDGRFEARCCPALHDVLFPKVRAALPPAGAASNPRLQSPHFPTIFFISASLPSALYNPFPPFVFLTPHLLSSHPLSPVPQRQDVCAVLVRLARHLLPARGALPAAAVALRGHLVHPAHPHGRELPERRLGRRLHHPHGAQLLRHPPAAARRRHLAGHLRGERAFLLVTLRYITTLYAPFLFCHPPPT